MNWFDELRGSTLCPFAKRSRVQRGPDWNTKQGYYENIREHSDAIADFVPQIESKKMHGIGFFVRTDSGLPGFEEVKTGFKSYLYALARFDESCAEVMRADLLSKDWQFTHSGERFFLNVFASFYGQGHSKYCKCAGGFGVFMQPERSFDFCGSRPLSEMKHEIRQRFAAAGMPYDGSQIDERIEALIYMFPEQPLGKPVRWWE